LKKNLLVIIIIWIASCQQPEKPKRTGLQKQDSYFKYARHVSVQTFDGFKLLHIIKAYPGAPDYKYVLKQKPARIPDSLSHWPVIEVPVKTLVVTSTTHLPALVMLHETGKLIGFPHTNYISNTELRQRVADGQITELGLGRRLNTEKLLALHPDVLVRFSSGSDPNNDLFLQNKGIPVIYNADWMEQTPLGRAEWLKLFGLLFQKERAADSIFNLIESRYNRIKRQIDSTLPKPLIFQGGIFGDKWFVPGGKSYAAQLIKDAGGQYMWEEDQHTGSVTLNFENVFLKLPKADIWLNPGLYHTKSEILNALPAAKDLKTFKTGRIYTYSLTKGTGGGILYFEESNAHPDRVLSDLFQIFHPNQNKSKLYYYKVLP